MTAAVAPKLVICPGFHDAYLTVQFLQALGWRDRALWWTDLSPLDGAGLCERVAATEPAASAIFVGFSAGVIGAGIAALLWQARGNRVAAVVALDGWGVPLPSDCCYPVYRLSHDCFTHLSSGWGESGCGRFYCDPPIAHMDLWRSPQQALGWQELRPGWRTRESAATYLQAILQRSEEP